MKVDEWLRFFKQHREKSLFSLSDLLLLTDESKPSLKVQLTRLVKGGVVTRAVKGWYENPFNTPTPEQIAMVLRYPSYISLEYALAKQGILSQRTHTLTLVTTKLPYTYSTSTNEYEYHQIKPELFSGYRREGKFLIAEPEKALIDLIYIRSVHGNEMSVKTILSLLEDMETEEFDRESLTDYKNLFDGKTRQIVERIGILP